MLKPEGKHGRREENGKGKMEKRKWDGRLIKKDECGGATPPDPNAFADDELLRLLRTALAGPKQKRKNAHRDIPIELLITLRKKKIPINAIARICKCSPQNVRERLAGKLQDIRMIDEYKNNRADILAYQQRRILGSITDDDINKAKLIEKSTSYGILYDKERLEMGKGVGGGNLVVAVVNFGDVKSKVDVPINVPIDVTPQENNGKNP